MSFTSTVSVELTYEQVVELARQLPSEQQQSLIGELKNEGGVGRKKTRRQKLSKEQLRANKERFLQGLEEAVAEVNAYKQGKPHSLRPLNEVLDEL